LLMKTISGNFLYGWFWLLYFFSNA
jgi:hypothetical protein